MRVQHLNCGTLHPPFAQWVVGEPVEGRRPCLVCHCLLIETDGHGLVLVDAGFGTADVRTPASRIGRTLLWMGRPELAIASTALAQIEARGLRADDVRHVVLTHLDVDHAGGLSDFPKARVHVHRQEHEAAMARRTVLEKNRYRPAHWEHGPAWELYANEGEPWFGFAAVRELAGLPPEILSIPLFGHTRGHCAIAVQEPGDGWLLHCGDGYFHRSSVGAPGAPPHPTGIGLFERVMGMDKRAVVANHERLTELAAENRTNVRLFCAHDAHELHAFDASH
jgi:glyoxylase-like metal-dependent hydrolase (beta-lactamase superfamily II)